MASLAAGDTRCGNGGASITDGTGNTAYACNGGTGALDLHSFSVASTAALTLTPGQAPAVVPGLSVQVTPAIASTYFVNADIWLALNVTATTAACGSFADGLLIGLEDLTAQWTPPRRMTPSRSAARSPLAPAPTPSTSGVPPTAAPLTSGVGLSKRHDGPPGKLTETHGPARHHPQCRGRPGQPADDPGLPGTSGGGRNALPSRVNRRPPRLARWGLFKGPRRAIRGHEARYAAT